MKIAIHTSEVSYSNLWISYCKDKDIEYKIVDCYRSDIIDQISDCDILMWHYHHKDSRDVLVARQLLCAAEAAGKTVYPDHNTRWFFDDKIGQKYLLEAIGAPLVPSYVFYSKKEALDWIEHTSYPKVFKLRKGSGSSNVRLVKNKKEASWLVCKAFGRGFRQSDPSSGLKDRYRLFKLGTMSYLDLLEGIARFFIKTRFERVAGRERGYVYFQDFVEGCTFDIRVTVIGDKCFAFKRRVRKNDFRASGSHDESHVQVEIPTDVLKIAFHVSDKISSQSLALDFLVTKEHEYLITEISHAFGWEKGDADNYWDTDLKLHKQPFNPFGDIIEELIRIAKRKKTESQ